MTDGVSEHLPGPWRVVVYPGDERGVRVFEILAPDDSSLSWEHEVLRATRTLIEAAPELLAVLKACEWAGVQRGQGTGFMGSGGDGRLVSACPLCRGINPKDPGRTEFIASAHGHQPSCRLHAVLVKAGGRAV